MPYTSSNGELYDDEDVLHLFPAYNELRNCEDDIDEEYSEVPEIDDLIDKWEFRLSLK